MPLQSIMVALSKVGNHVPPVLFTLLALASHVSIIGFSAGLATEFNSS